MTQKPLIQVQELTFEYPNTRALDHVSFNVTQGSITALVGPNGAGKSTLLRCIAALDTPLNGQVLLNGMDVMLDPRASHQKIGYLSDNFGLYETLTVQQCLTYAALAQGVGSGEVVRVMDEVAQKLELTDKLSHTAGNLSRGQRQRVAIGQAIIHSPSVLLLDEPASGLDPEARYHLSQVFIALKNSGMTLIVSSHILAELEDYSTEMLVLKNGKVLQQQVVLSHNMAHSGVTISLALASASTLELANQLLAQMPAVSHVEVNAQRIQLQLDELQLTRHNLLKALVMAHVEVNDFTLVEANMQQNYLKAVGAHQLANERT
ncbi:MAG: ABC transporter ATP-binding protein [Methylophilaceae bacterium]